MEEREIFDAAVIGFGKAGRRWPVLWRRLWAEALRSHTR